MADAPYHGDEAWDDPDHLDDVWSFDGTLFQFSQDDETVESGQDTTV